MKHIPWGFVIFVTVALAAIYGLSRLTSRTYQPTLPPTALTESQKTKQASEHRHEQEAEAMKVASVSMPTESGKQMGSPTAKVKVIAVLPPSECQIPTLLVLDEIAKADPKRVRVEIYSMASPKGMQILRQYGATCASVFINGKTEFTLTSDGETRYVVCQKTPGMSYQSTDLIEIVHMELKRLYGRGFDEATLKKLREKGRQIVTGTTHSEAPNPSAKVVVEVLAPPQRASIYPLFSETVKVLERLKERHGKDLSLSVYVLTTAEGQKRMHAYNLTGPAVVINGKTVHEIQGPFNTKRKVVTAFGASPTLFTPKDVAEVVNAYLRQSQK